jgi:hypothetical protein
MTKPTGLRIPGIHNQRSGSKNLEDEYVVIVNQGHRPGICRGGWSPMKPINNSGLMSILSPEHLTSGRGWKLDPGDAIFVTTGPGDDTFIAHPASAGNRPQFHFHWNRTSFVWNNSGDRVYLRHPDGRFATEPFPIP